MIESSATVWPGEFSRDIMNIFFELPNKQRILVPFIYKLISKKDFMITSNVAFQQNHEKLAYQVSYKNQPNRGKLYSP